MTPHQHRHPLAFPLILLASVGLWALILRLALWVWS